MNTEQKEIQERAKTIKARFKKMNSSNLLSLVAKGKMDTVEANVAAGIIQKRFPNPEGVSNLRHITSFKIIRPSLAI